MTEYNKMVKESIAKVMHQNKGLDASGIEAYKILGILFLKGTVSRESEKALAEQIAFSIPVPCHTRNIPFRLETGKEPSP